MRRVHWRRYWRHRCQASRTFYAASSRASALHPSKKAALPPSSISARSHAVVGPLWPEHGPEVGKTALRCMCKQGTWRVHGLATCGRNARPELSLEGRTSWEAASQHIGHPYHPSAMQHVSAGGQSSLCRVAAETRQDKAAKTATKRLKWKALRNGGWIGKVR